MQAKNTVGTAHRTRLCASLAAAFGLVSGVNAAVPIPVTNCTDDDVVDSLRNVIAGVVSPGATIDVSACSTITLSQGEIAIGVAMTIAGPSGGATTTIDANHKSRVFNASVDTEFHAITMTGGLVEDVFNAQGGCILSGDTNSVILQDSVLTDCTANSPTGAAYGGAIRAGFVTLTNSRVEKSIAYSTSSALALGGGVSTTHEFHCTSSTLSGNKALALPTGVGQGGGVFAFGSMTMDSCTVDSNVAQNGGGVNNYSTGVFDAVSMRNSTISGNQALTQVGGLYSNHELPLKNSTVAFNSAPLCGGIFVTNYIIADSNIVAHNTSDDPGCVDLDAKATISGANNLVSVETSDLPLDTIVADPKLTPLADRGGPTQTHGLSLSSPAIDAGSNVDSVSVDQRGTGFLRDVPSVGYADIGAFERQIDDDEIFYGGFD